MRTVLAVLMFASMIQVAQADDDDSSTTTTSGGTATSCITSVSGIVTCL